MTQLTPNSKRRAGKLYQPLAIAALMASSLIQPFVLPALAAAGDTISNTATATYEDEDGNPFETESNTVDVTVAEIAGITVTPANVVDQNGGSFEDGDILDFQFTVTNVGNDTTDVQLPGIDDIATENFTVTQVEVFDSTGTSLGTYNSTDPQLLSGLTPGLSALQADDFITVVVTGTVEGAGLNPGDDISVTLGDTPPNDNSPSTQNQPIGDSDSNVETVDLADGADANEAPGTPDEEKEASATQSVDFATEQRPLALATVTKTDSSVDPGATGSANDDIVTYDLTLTVEDTSPSGSFIPEDLATTPIMLDGSSVDVVLVSDTIPEFTVLSAVDPNSTLPSGWEIIYSTADPNATSPVIAAGATPATWSTTAPSNLSTVTRIGFIERTNTPLPANGTAITGFQFEVITSGLPAAGGSVYNLAQVFGTTYDDPANPNDPVDQIIYDESGDDNPNNFNDDATPPTETDGGTPDGSDYDPVEDTGVADPDNHDTDDGSNTGTGEMGEDNEVVLTGEEETGDDNILNGPDANPDAVGPTDDDDDYTNMGINPSTAGADTVEFTNTVANPTSNTSQIDNVTVEPINPTTALANDDEDPDGSTDKYGDASLIPVGTTVTIAYDVDGDGTVETAAEDEMAVYTWNGTDWVTTDTPINIGTLQPGEAVDYTVTVDFPAGDPPAEGEVIDIPIIAFPDTGLDGYDGETVNNITIDRIYVGFISITKEARILDTDGTTVLEDWTATPSVDAEPGQFIEYRITYENTSPSLVGSGNVSLNAQNVRIVEDGDIFDLTSTVGDNNWHSDVTTPLTVHANGTTVSTGTVNYYDEFDETAPANDSLIGTVDPSDDALVEAYVNEVGTVAPGNSGTMIFRRKVQ